MCMNNFFFSGQSIERYPITEIGMPKKDGIYEVRELLFDTKDIKIPKTIKKIP